jgi:23S rRNA pseudouridine2605 synthase
MPSPKNPKEERLQKVLAHAGVASRRASEGLIQAGRVRVNGRVVTELGTKVNPRQDTITVDGKPLPRSQDEVVYIILNKPRNVLSAASDDRGRRTVLDLVDIDSRVYPVGRLDLQSEGLILLTNDGELTRRLTHPAHHVEKEYHVLVSGKPSTEALSRWRNGELTLEGKPLAPAKVIKMSDEGEKSTWLRIVLTEGRKRQIREVARMLGHHVRTLQRVRLGPIRLGKLKMGRWRHLTPTEVQRLKQAVR